MTTQSSWEKYKKKFGKSLTNQCEMVVDIAIKRELITKEEWDNRFKDFCDDCGHSFVHLLEASIADLDVFLTLNEVILKNKKELEKRFKIKICDTKELEKLSLKERRK